MNTWLHRCGRHRNGKHECILHGHRPYVAIREVAYAWLIRSRILPPRRSDSSPSSFPFPNPDDGRSRSIFVQELASDGAYPIPGSTRPVRDAFGFAETSLDARLVKFLIIDRVEHSLGRLVLDQRRRRQSLGVICRSPSRACDAKWAVSLGFHVVYVIDVCLS
jgi:hypothetical protein